MASSDKVLCLGILGIIGLLLFLILFPLSFSYIDYYDYGLKQRKSTGKVKTSRVYDSGRYFIGPDYKFLKYQADAHLIKLDDLSVFSAGGADSIGLEFLIDIDLTYFLQEDKIGLIHREMAKNYDSIILSRTRDAIKNSAITVTFSQYFQDRKTVEKQFRDAVQRRWDETNAYVTLDQFHVGRIQIPQSVADKQLESRIQIERNDRESFIQQARIERELTAVEVNKINLERELLLQTTEAESNLIQAKAVAEAEQIKADAKNKGTLELLNSAGITSQEDITAFTYIRTLKNHENVDMSISYISDENVVKTSEQA